MYFEDKVFDNINTLERGEYENCSFSNCHLASASLLGCRFIDCVFENSDLSLVKIEGVTFQDVVFKDCKLLGVRFDNINNFGLGLEFENCRLDHASFIRLKLKNTRIKNSNLSEVDFTDTELNGSIFENCNLNRAVFNNTNLEKVDLRTSFNFIIDPEENRMRGARVGLSSVAGLLMKYNITIDPES